MTLDEMRQELKLKTSSEPVCVVGERVTLPKHVFIMTDDTGFARYMTYTEDGKIVPVDLEGYDYGR